MAQIIDYKVISEYGTDALSKKVMAAVRAGWQPLGGATAFVHLINSSTGQTGQMFSQALVKYQPE